MKIKVPSEWIMKKAHLEEGHEVSAGVLANVARYAEAVKKPTPSRGFYCQECGNWTPENLRYLTEEYGDICRGCGNCA